MTITESRMTKEDYKKNQAESGLKVGDMIKVTRTAHDGEDGWSNVWMEYMTEGVNKTGKIMEITDLGIRTDISPFTFPFFVLEKVEQ